MVKRFHVEIIAAIILGLVAALAIATGLAPMLPHKGGYTSIPDMVAIKIPAASDPLSASAPKVSSDKLLSIPVLSYHQIDNGCAPTATECSAVDSVSQQEFYNQMNWLYQHGYRTITMPEYQAWVTGQNVNLPYRPILLTVDDGIANFYGPATPVLKHFGYNMTSMVVSGFAQGAQNGVRQYKGWDATWTQLSNLPSSVWGFAFHAGALGHLLNKSSSTCPYFYVCQGAHESAATYEARITGDINAAITAERQKLGARVDTQVWAAPFNDLAQTSAEPQSGSAPRAWLNAYSAHRFSVVFVDGLTTQGNQHYRYEVHGTDSLAFYGQQVLRDQTFTRHPGAITGTVREGGQS